MFQGILALETVQPESHRYINLVQSAVTPKLKYININNFNLNCILTVVRAVNKNLIREILQDSHHQQNGDKIMLQFNHREINLT